MTAAKDLGIQGIDEVESLDIEGSAIFRARQMPHNRPVAIKVLDPHQEPLVPRRFGRKPLQRFAVDPGVVKLYEAGETAGGDQFLMMPYFRIGSLADQLGHGPMPWHRAAELMLRASEIVSRAHALGVVLGDLKPSSIMLADASSPLISVYGMATRRFDDGTPSYAAPEAGRGVAPSPTADVYSLSLILAALIAGRPPNRGPLSREFLAEVSARAPIRIVEVINHGLAPQESNRPADAGRLAAALSAAISGDEPTVSPAVADDDGPEPFDLDDLLGIGAVGPTIDLTGANGGNGEVGGGVSGGNGATPALVTTGVEPSTTTASGSPRPSDDTVTAGPPPAPPPATAEVDPDVIDLRDFPPPSMPADDGAVDEPALDLGRFAPPETAEETTIIELEEERPSPAPLAAGPLAAGPLTADEQVPFRSFDRQPLVPAHRGPAVRVLDGLRHAGDQLRRSLGGLLAVAGLAVTALIVGVLLTQERRPPATTGPGSTFSTVLEEGSPSTFAPTSEVPAFSEPPATNLTTTTRRIVRTTRTTAATTTPTTAPPSTTTPTTSGTTSQPPTTGTTRPPTTQPPTTQPPTTGTTSPPTSASTSPPTSASTLPPQTTTTRRRPTTTDDDDGPLGPTTPLIEDAAVTRVRATTARVSFSSSECVTASFTYAAAGAAPTTVNGGSRCARAHTLLLGTVTPRLSPGTRYTVTISARDGDGRTSRTTVSFTTLG